MTTFILVNPEREVSSIAVLISFRGKKYKKSTGESVRVRQWSTAKKRVKVTAGNTEAELINDSLDKWEEAARKTISYFKEKTYVPSSAEFISVLEEYRYGKPTNSRIDMVEYTGQFIERYTGILSEGCMKQYRLVRNLLSRYSADNKKIIHFEDIDVTFYNSFMKWFYRQGYSVNYFGAVIKDIKRIMGEAQDVDKLHNNTEYKSRKFSAPKEEADNIYLTVEELIRMHRLVLDKAFIMQSYPDLLERKCAIRARAYAKARDMFLIGAFTGLRFSDFSRLKNQNISDLIEIKTQKTGTKVAIPVHWVVKEILESGYDFSGMSNQKLNEYIKEVARLAGIDERVTVNRNIGGKNVEETFLKYELVSSHTARRSFATNAYKAGVPTIAIMKITGHRRESNFLKYIKVGEKENAELLKSHSFFNK